MDQEPVRDSYINRFGFMDLNSPLQFIHLNNLQPAKPSEEELSKKAIEELDQAVCSIHKERQRDEQEDALAQDERAGLKKALDTQREIQSLKERREAVKNIQHLCRDNIVDASRKSALIDILNGELMSISYKIGTLI